MTLRALVLWSSIILLYHSGFLGLAEASKNFRVSTNQQRNVRESGAFGDTFSMRENLESKKISHKEELRTRQKSTKSPQRSSTWVRNAYPLDISTPSHVSAQYSEPLFLLPMETQNLEINSSLEIQTTEGDENSESTTTCQMFQSSGFLTEEQSSLCKDNFNGVMAALIGSRLGLLECSYQFQFERWNCSVNSPRLTTLMEHDLVTFEDTNTHRNASQSLPSLEQVSHEESDPALLPNKNIKVADLRLERQPPKRPKITSRATKKTQRKRQFRRSMQGFVQIDNAIVEYPANGQLGNLVSNEGSSAGKKKSAKERLNNRLRPTAKRSEGEQATKETAFIHAITSAGVAYAVTESCSAGNLTDCSCLAGPGTLSTAADNSRKPRYSEVSPRSEDDGWKWGGCSDNIEFGLRYAEKFTDVPEMARQSGSDESLKFDRKKELKSLVNLHNNEVGRKVLFSLMKMKCRCHGVSGSCGVRTCWRALPNFREVGDTLKKKYESSVEISPKIPTFDISTTFDSSRKALPEADGKNILLRREKRRRREPISDTELVYVEKSPNYCKKDLVKGITGTKGRVCKRDSEGPESCETLCCGRGYRVEVVKSLERCNCRFVWCCTVHCRTCEKIEKRYTCK